ncbi:MAG: trypsin-like serine protease, partial [Bacteroidales bacterium]|nr:trypsin-like serine protease [Bacteroidales bacterium]
MSDFTKSIRSLVFIACLAIISFVIPESANAQISYGGTPKSFITSKSITGEKNVSVSFDEIVLRAPNVELLRSEDAQSDKNGTPPRVGVSLPYSASKETAGNWTDLPDGGRLWTLKITSSGATAMSVFFDSWYMTPGSSMFCYNENRKQVIGSFNHNNNLDNGTFATEMIQGESIYIEYYEPKFKRGESYFHIGSVGYFYEELAGLSQYKDNVVRVVGASESCHVNVNCSPVGDDWQDEKRGVAQITFKVGASWYLCTGSLVNNTSYDATPYFLTAFHCGAADASVADLNQWVFKFKYEAVGCTNPSTEPATKSITGCTRKAEGNIVGGSDFFLLLLNSTPTVDYVPYYNGWDRSDNPTSTGVGIHHPNGDIKKISTYGSLAKSGGINIGGSIMGANTSYTVRWASNANGYGVTAGGSSGSPLFNTSGYQIGTLTGGSSSCTSQTLTDVYGRFSYHWISNGGTSAYQLKPWLDPTSSGTTILPGYDPFATAPPEIHFYADRNYILEGDAINFTDASLSP